MTTICDLCGSEEDCIPVLHEVDYNGQKIIDDTGCHVCKKHCKEVTGMEYDDYIRKYKYDLAGKQ